MGLDIKLDPELFFGETAMVISAPWDGWMAFNINLETEQITLKYQSIVYEDVWFICDFVDFIIDSIIWEEILAAVFRLEGYEMGLKLDNFQIYNMDANSLFMERQKRLN